MGLVGRPFDSLTLEERFAHAGKWIALEIYTPQNLSLRRIEAAGASPSDCIRQLSERGQDARQFEFRLLPPPY